MKIAFVLKESIYDCKIQITDAQGDRYYLLATRNLNDDDGHDPYIFVDICGDAFDVTLIPLMPDTAPMLNELEDNNWKDKFAKTAAKLMVSSLDKMLLRVGCRYHICDLQDGDRLDISLQSYAFGTFDRFDLLELIPMMYMFFEASHFNKRCALADAYETNRKDVLRSAKALALTDVLGNGMLATLFTYPIQVSRIKRLSKNKKIRKVLAKFNDLSDLERQRILEKQEKFFDGL